ncbi:MAG: hypothetical protein HYY04_05810 [Chloroflexi bacterium]|nr:hypothetical protein [Chloroflexota bacterium]
MPSLVAERRLASQPVLIRRQRQLPADGRILVEPGDTVRATEIIGRARVPGRPFVLPVAETLRLSDGKIMPYLRRQPGEAVHAGEVIARRRRVPFGERLLRAPVDGTLANGPVESGELLLIPASRDVELRAFVPGTVVSITPRRAAMIETVATLVTGLTGIGGEAVGPLRIVGEQATAVLNSTELDEADGGAVVVAGCVTEAGLARARELGIVAVVAGSVHASVLTAARREGGLALVVVDGFGSIGSSGMAPEVHDVLRLHQGRVACVQATPAFPEVILPLGVLPGVEAPPELRLAAGALVRVVGGVEGTFTGRIERLGPAFREGPFGASEQWAEVAGDRGRHRVAVGQIELLENGIAQSHDQRGRASAG